MRLRVVHVFFPIFMCASHDGLHCSGSALVHAAGATTTGHLHISWRCFLGVVRSSPLVFAVVRVRGGRGVQSDGRACERLLIELRLRKPRGTLQLAVNMRWVRWWSSGRGEHSLKAHGVDQSVRCEPGQDIKHALCMFSFAVSYFRRLSVNYAWHRKCST